MGEQVACGARGREVPAGPDRAQRAAQVDTSDRDPGQPVRGKFLGNGEFAQYRGPGARGHCRLHRRGGRQCERHRHGHPRAQRRRQRSRQHAFRPGSLLPADQPGSGQFSGAERAAAARPPMVGADHHEQFVMADDPAVQPSRAARAFDEAEVGVTVADLLGDGVAVGHGQDHIGWGLAAVARSCLQGHQPPGQQLLGDGEARAHPEAGPVVMPEGGQPGVQFARHRQQPRRPLGDDNTLRGERGPARGT